MTCTPGDNGASTSLVSRIGRGSRRRDAVAWLLVLALAGPVVAASDPVPSEPEPAATETDASPTTPAKRDKKKIDPDQVQSAKDTNVASVLDELTLERFPLLRYHPLRRVRRRWHTARDKLDAKIGLRLGLTMTSVLQHAPTIGNPNDSLVSTFDFFARWSLVHNERFGEGALLAQFRVRENWGATTGNELSTNIGLPWSVNNGGTDSYDRVNQLYWEHFLLDDDLTITFGRIDQTNFFDLNRVAGSGTTLFLMDPLVNSQTIPFPSNGIGFNVEYHPLDWLVIRAGFGDAQGDPNQKPEANFGDMFDNIFKAAEVVVRPDLSELRPWLGRGAYRILGWHTDDSGDPAVGTGAAPNREGGGYSLSLDQEFGEELIGFLRFGHSPNTGLRTETELSLGVGTDVPFGRRSDFAGVGATVGNAIGADDDQYTAEVFYRMELLEGLALTPDVQLLFNPVQSHDDIAVVFSLRTRFVF